MWRAAVFLLVVVLAAEKGEGADFSCNGDRDGDGQVCQCSASAGVSSGTFNTTSSGNYKNNQECLWMISAPNEGTIALSFYSFNTESGDDLVSIYRCSDMLCLNAYDYGKSQFVNPTYVLSGNTISSSTTYTSDTGYMFIVFESDADGRRDGFEAGWWVAPTMSSSTTAAVSSSTPAPTTSSSSSSTPAPDVVEQQLELAGPELPHNLCCGSLYLNNSRAKPFNIFADRLFRQST